MKAFLFISLYCITYYTYSSESSNIDKVLSFFSELNSRELECERCVSFHDPNAPEACPDFFIKQILEKDYSSTFFLKSSVKQCRSASKFVSSGDTKWGFESAEDLETYLRGRKEFSSFKSSPAITRCVSQSIVLDSMDQPKALPEDQQKIAVAEYYFTLKRLQDSLQGNIEDLAGIDTLIGGRGRLLRGISCNNLDLAEEAKANCEEIKRCSSDKGRLLEEGQNTLVVMQAIEVIDAKIKNLKGLRSRTARKNAGEIKTLRERRKNLQSLYPWVTGKVFQGGYDPEKIKTKEQMAGLIRKQLEKTKEKLKKQFQDVKQVLSCVTGVRKRGCSQEGVGKVISQTSILPIKDIFGSERKKMLENAENLNESDKIDFSRESLAEVHFAEVECRQINRGLIKEQNRELVLAGFDTIAVIGTMGLGSAIVMARLAAKAGLAVRARRIQMGALIALDTAFSAPYMKEAYEICSTEVDKLEREEAQALSSHNVCERFPVRSRLSGDYTSCILSASLASLPITLPLAGLVGGHLYRVSKRADSVTKLPANQQSSVTDVSNKEVVKNPHRDELSHSNATDISTEQALNNNRSRLLVSYNHLLKSHPDDEKGVIMSAILGMEKKGMGSTKIAKKVREAVNRCSVK